MMYLFKKEVSSGNNDSDHNRCSLSGFEERSLRELKERHSASRSVPAGLEAFLKNSLK